ncbi:MAG: hypothetical protein V1772_06900, partial [Chloroflexota bacterium]
VVSVTVSGANAGQAFERGAFAVIGVADGRACLHPPHRLEAPAEGGLRADIGVDEPLAGDYLLSVELEDGRGAVVRVAHPVRLEPGAQTVTEPVAPRALPEGVATGAWRLGEISLLDLSGAALPLDEGGGESGGGQACP